MAQLMDDNEQIKEDDDLEEDEDDAKGREHTFLVEMLVTNSTDCSDPMRRAPLPSRAH